MLWKRSGSTQKAGSNTAARRFGSCSGSAFSAALLAATLFSPGPSSAEQPPPITFYKKVSFIMNVEYSSLSTDLDLPRDLRMHRTHTDDDFLEGDPGETNLDRMELDTTEIGAGLAVRPEFRNIAIIGQLVAKLPTRLDARLERQQDNDPRPPSTASYIYTKIEDVRMMLALRLGLGGAVLLSKQDWWLEVRGLCDVGRTRMRFDKGWTRYGQDEFETRSEADAWYFSPKIKAAVGTRRWLISIGYGYAQMTFHHADSRIVNHTGKGSELSFGIAHKR
jgi:hypothetical protein